MKLGIFGDSYADGDTECWPQYLSQNLNIDYNNHARSGTSTFYSYKNFLENYKQYTHIVFTYSYPTRIHSLPEKYEGLNFVKPHDTHENFMRIKGVVFIYFRFLQNDLLDSIIQQKIYDDVQDICQQNDIKLVNIIPFEPCRFDNIKFTKRKNTFSNLLGLDKISWEELMTARPEDYDSYNYGIPDSRECHLTPENNKILATLIADCFEQNQDRVLQPNEFNLSRKYLKKFFP